MQSPKRNIQRMGQAGDYGFWHRVDKQGTGLIVYRQRRGKRYRYSRTQYRPFPDGLPASVGYLTESGDVMVPRWKTNGTESKGMIDEVKVVVEAFARDGFEYGMPSILVILGTIGRADLRG